MIATISGAIALWVGLFKIVLKDAISSDNDILYVGIVALIILMGYYYASLEKTMSPTKYRIHLLLTFICFVAGFALCYTKTMFAWGILLIIMSLLHYTWVTEGGNMKSPIGSVAVYMIAIAAGFIMCFDKVFLYLGLPVVLYGYIRFRFLIYECGLENYRLFKLLKPILLISVIIVPTIGILSS